ncbi:urease accessory protein UreF [Neptunomonas phycophila]|jgi:urease accessory protein|uniref:urease accessory protein UreF n=1 Tax=Neptunomonas TaxID=75687 RepID=UPI0009489A9B|nr:MULTISPECIES: urease accessory protein UreF [Neptunomonas]MBT3144504.1 urease accessory protein UreF [Neptunomonas phycophila]MDN2660650.1 urease accessory protein UreF [Neptunomonas sp. CHC150]MDO6784147.1 urease accessory protein UreF [Neptunomonas phycophila]QLE96587.1 urease accessory protein UreF [Neptunomonas phycophila]
MLADLRLYQLISPSLPIGAFTYSQGLEWAIEAGWVKNEQALEQWLESVLAHSVSTLELPVMIRLCRAFEGQDIEAVHYWTQFLIASRETSELRKEERQRGQALATLLPNLNVAMDDSVIEAVRSTQIAGFALAAQQFDISIQSACAGYLWSWLENAVMAGVKLVPLGQTSGQKLLMRLSERVPTAVERALAIVDDEVGSSTPALAIASSRHETQYTRLFRS